MAEEIEQWQGAVMGNRGQFPPLDWVPVPPVPIVAPEPEPVPVIEYEYSWRFYKNWWNKIKALLGIIPPAKRRKEKKR